MRYPMGEKRGRGCGIGGNVHAGIGGGGRGGIPAARFSRCGAAAGAGVPRGRGGAGASGGAGGAEGESVVHRDKVAADSEQGSQRPAWTRGGAEPPEGRTRAAAELQSPCGAVPARVQRLRQQRYHRPVERGISTPVRPG